MGKYKAVFISIMLILLVSLVLPACAPAKPAAPAATPPAAPAATPPAVPVATPPAVPAPKALSFEPATYTNDAIGFTWQYPKTWVKTDNYNNLVVKMLASTAQGADNAGVIVIPESADYSKAVKEQIDSDPGLLNTKVDISPAKTITLADGKTAASEATATAKIMGLYPLYVYSIGINKGGKTIIVFGASLGNDTKQALVKEIAQTLAVK